MMRNANIEKLLYPKAATEYVSAFRQSHVQR